MILTFRLAASSRNANSSFSTSSPSSFSANCPVVPSRYDSSFSTHSTTLDPVRPIAMRCVFSPSAQLDKETAFFIEETDAADAVGKVVVEDLQRQRKHADMRVLHFIFFSVQKLRHVDLTRVFRCSAAQVFSASSRRAGFFPVSLSRPPDHGRSAPASDMPSGFPPRRISALHQIPRRNTSAQCRASHTSGTARCCPHSSQSPRRYPGNRVRSAPACH